MKMIDVLKKHGYQRDPILNKPFDVATNTKPALGFGRGSTAGSDPQWRSIVIVRTNGEWAHQNAAGETLMSGNGSDALDACLTSYHAPRRSRRSAA